MALSSPEKSITIVTKDVLIESNTKYAQGAILAALILVRRMMLPLRALQEAAERVSAGGGVARDFQPVPARGPDEIATPIRSFNQMVDRIGSLLRELNGEIGQRREAEAQAEAARARLTRAGETVSIIGTIEGSGEPEPDVVVEGLEAALDARLAERDGLRWDVRLTLSTSDDEITDLPAPVAFFESAQSHREGHPVGAYFGRPVTVDAAGTAVAGEEAYLGTPWVWPSVWTENEAIENPHLIRPGDKIWITAGEMRRVTADEAEALLANEPPEEEAAEPPAARRSRRSRRPASRRRPPGSTRRTTSGCGRRRHAWSCRPPGCRGRAGSPGPRA